MANALFAKGKEKTLSAAINFPSDTMKAALVLNSYSQNLATHEFFTDISTHVVGTPQTLANKTITAGVFDADDVTFSSIAGGSTAKCVVIYKDTGVAGTSPLLAFIDVITGFPLATNGGDITIQWDNGAFKVFAL